MFVLVKRYFKLTIACKNIHKASTSVFVTLPQITMFSVWNLCDYCEVEVKATGFIFYVYIKYEK